MADPMMGMMGGGDMGEEPSSPEAAEPMDEESAAAVEAFPELAGDPGRIEALKTFVRLCSEKAMGGGYDEEEPKPKADLLLAFGAPGKAKKK
jgi:hypothetical protein